MVDDGGLTERRVHLRARETTQIAQLGGDGRRVGALLVRKERRSEPLVAIVVSAAVDQHVVKVKDRVERHHGIGSRVLDHPVHRLHVMQGLDCRLMRPVGKFELGKSGADASPHVAVIFPPDQIERRYQRDRGEVDVMGHADGERGVNGHGSVCHPQCGQYASYTAPNICGNRKNGNDLADSFPASVV